MPAKNSKHYTTKQQKNNISTNDLPDSCICFRCLETINESENNIKCHLCDNQAHLACLNLNKSLADLLKESDTFPCLCPSCFPKLNKLSTLPDRVESIESLIHAIERLATRFETTIQASLIALGKKIQHR
uniref:Zinc finger PHD-type domain-containing protein n=1 Tax=Micrurus spixii TaxID=129469 RepID=A0A2D4LXL1_9SAUR